MANIDRELWWWWFFTFLFTCSAVVLVILAYFTGVDPHKSGSNCYTGASALNKWAFLLLNLSFFCFIKVHHQLVLLGKDVTKRSSKTSDDVNIKRRFFYIVLDIVYIVFKTLQFKKCGNDKLFEREISNSIVTYILNDIIIMSAQFDFDDLGVSTFIITTINVGLQYCVKTFAYDMHLTGNVIFSYYNIAQANYVFMASFGSVTKFVKQNEEYCWNGFLYFLYICPKLLKSIYYSVPSDKRGKTNGLFWFASVYEMTVLIIVLLSCLVIWDDKDKREKKETIADGDNLRTGVNNNNI